MMADQFTWDPISATCSVKPNVYNSPFGDGYEQNSPKGINWIQETWSLQFRLNEIYAEELLSFLKSQGGYLKFTWTPPKQTTQKLWLCKSWQPKDTPGVVKDITAIFTQQFGL